MATAVKLILVAICIYQAGDLPASRWAIFYTQALAGLNRGDSAAAEKIAEPAYRAWRNAPGSRWYWPFRLILAESLLEQDRTTEARPLLDHPAPNAAWEARRLVGLAFIYYRAKDDAATAALLDSAEAVNPKDAREVTGKIHLIRGSMQLRANRPAEAEACFHRALDAVGGSGSLVESYTLTDLGVGDLRSFRNDEAVTWFQRSRALAQRSGASRAVVLADSNLGVCFRRLGDLDLALQYLEEAASVAGRLQDRVNLLRVLTTAGETSLDLGENARAQGYFERAQRLTSPGKDDEWLAMILTDLSEVLRTRGDLPAADRFNRQAADVSKRLQAERPRLAQQIQEGQIAIARRDFAAAKTVFDQATIDATDLGDPLAQWQCHAGLASVYRALGRTADTESEYRLAIGIIEDQRSKLTHDEFKLSFLSNLISFYDDYVDFLIERGDQARAFRVAQSCRARLLAEKGQQSGSAPALILDSLQHALRTSGATLWSYWLAPGRSFVWVVDGAGLQAVALPAEPEISAHVRQYGDAIQSDTNPLETGNAAGRWLFSNVVQPAIQGRPTRNIVIQPDGALHQLNFESLPVDGNRFWIEDATVSIAPSPALLRDSAIVPQERLLLFGDPDQADSNLPRLPNLKAELDAVAKHFPAKRIYKAGEATPAAYRGAHAETYSTLHFAAHAIANRESPLDSAIILAGPPDSRKLYARDLVGQTLTAELVTLSACQTAGSRTYYGEGLMGFSWAFLSAGAHNVVAGLWPVDDRATARLMGHFYDAIAAGQPPARALRQAKLELMADSALYPTPRYWAAFETFTRALYR